MGMKDIGTMVAYIAAIHAGVVEFFGFSLGSISPIIPQVVYGVGGVVGALLLFKVWK